MYENQRKTHDMSCWLTKNPESTAMGMIDPGASRTPTSVGQG